MLFYVGNRGLYNLVIEYNFDTTYFITILVLNPLPPKPHKQIRQMTFSPYKTQNRRNIQTKFSYKPPSAHLPIFMSGFLTTAMI